MKRSAVAMVLLGVAAFAPQACKDSNEQPAEIAGAPASEGGSSGGDRPDEESTSTGGDSEAKAGASGQSEPVLSAAAGAGGEGGRGDEVPTELLPRAPLVCEDFVTGDGYVMPDGEVVPRTPASRCASNNTCNPYMGEEKALCCDVGATLLYSCDWVALGRFSNIEEYCHFAVLYAACMAAHPSACDCIVKATACQRDGQVKKVPPEGICEQLGTRAELSEGPWVYVGNYQLDPTGEVATDVNTGLIWQRNIIANTIPNPSGPNPRYQLPQAQDFCDKAMFGGLTGWRVPTRDELLTIVYGQTPPTVNPKVFPSTPASLFWTTTAMDVNGFNYYAVDFAMGKSATGGVPDNSLYLRCVREG